MTCQKCRARVAESDAFCAECGHPTRPSPGLATFSGQNTVAPMRERAGTVLQKGAVFAGRYEILSLLGQGGMGVVYLAKDAVIGEEVVLKLLHPNLVGGEDAVQRLIREGATARRITHKNIVRVHDVGEADGQPYLTMEYVSGGTLRTWMTTEFHARKLVPFETAVGIVRALLAGLDEAHRSQFVHRDLKPENVLLASDLADGRFNLKILDFGIARAVDAPRTSGGGPIGTPLYMAPEQLTAGDAAGPSADIYSLSAMFYELLMQVVPGAGGWEPVSKARPDVPAGIDRVFERGLARTPLSRFQSVAEFSTALDQVMADASKASQAASAEAERQAARERLERAEAERRREAEARQQGQSEAAHVVDRRGAATTGWWANLSTNAKAGIVGGAVVIALASMWPDGPDPPVDPPVDPAIDRPVTPDGPDRPVTPVAPEPRPLPPLAGRWTHWNGTVFQIQMNGRAFSGADPRGPRIEGAFDNDWNATFVIRDAMGNVMYQAPTAQLVDTGNGYHLVYEGGAQTLFVNENPHY
jgi:hypothetical protein